MSLLGESSTLAARPWRPATMPILPVDSPHASSPLQPHAGHGIAPTIHPDWVDVTRYPVQISDNVRTIIIKDDGMVEKTIKLSTTVHGAVRYADALDARKAAKIAHRLARQALARKASQTLVGPGLMARTLAKVLLTQ